MVQAYYPPGAHRHLYPLGYTATMATSRTDTPEFGEKVEGIDVPVFNERAVRAAAGILFVVGFTVWNYSWYTGDVQPLRAFAIIFLIDMGIRVAVNHRFAPSMALGALIVRRQRPEWVGAAQKGLAWWLGFGIAFIACLGIGFGGLPAAFMFAMCGLCLFLMFLEAAFGICVGCELYRRFSKTPPQLCPGDVCNYSPPTRRSLFSGRSSSA